MPLCSNGWDDATAALQLLSHLEGYALNVALLVPAPQGALHVGLVDALTTHYGSPGRLADYRRQFEKTTRTAFPTYVVSGPNRVAAVTTPQFTPDQVEEFCRRLLASVRLHQLRSRSQN